MQRAFTLSQGVIDFINNAMPANQVAALGDLVDQSLAAGIPFDVQATITSTAAGTAVVILPDSWVPTGWIVRINTLFVRVTGSTAWSGGSFTKLFIDDNAGATSNSFAEVAVANMTGSAILTNSSTGVTIHSGMSDQGGTASVGVRMIGDADAGAGSDVIVRIIGHIMPS